MANRSGKIDFEDLQYEKKYDAMASYAQSKLAELMFALELERRLRRSGSTITSVACHPGVAPTNLLRGVGNPVLATIRHWVISMLGGTVESGTFPTLFASTSKEAVGGGYYGPQGLGEARGRAVGDAQVVPQAKDEAVAKRLWEVSEKLTGVSYLGV